MFKKASADLRQRSSDERYFYLCGSPSVIARRVAREGIQSQRYLVVPTTGTVNPCDPSKPGCSEVYRELQKGNFADWRLSVEGKVARPGTYSLADLKGLPSRTQITRHTCEEGWTAIGEWTGVPLSRVLDAAGMLPNARFVGLYSYDEWVDYIDMFDALHPQTILAYGMNGRDLPIAHGAPVRLRVERQLGYKSMKYIQRIVVAENFDDGGRAGAFRMDGPGMWVIRNCLIGFNDLDQTLHPSFSETSNRLRRRNDDLTQNFKSFSSRKGGLTQYFESFSSRSDDLNLARSFRAGWIAVVD